MSTDQNFEILLSIDGNPHQDINYFCAFRMPVIKQASYFITKAFLPQVTIKSIMSAIGRNIYPAIGVKIYSNSEENDRKKSKLIYDQKLTCINCSTDEKIEFDQEKSHGTLILVHPILRFLENTNVYNRIHREMTPYDMLRDFENYLKSNHGEIFSFNHIGADIEKNNYTYENILIKPKNDLNVPSYLIHNYKINNSFGFYFFDNFSISKNDSKEINCRYINIFDRNEFEQVDVNEWADLSHSPNYQKEVPFYDYFQELDKEGHRTILVQQDIRYKHKKKPEESNILRKDPGDKAESALVKNRTVNFEENGTESETPISNASTSSRIYCPDNIDNGDKRFNIGKEIFKEKIECLDLYEFSNCLPDFPQFGKIYNLYQGGPIEEFIITPLNICNVFKRINRKEQTLYHFSKVLFIRYSGE